MPLCIGEGYKEAYYIKRLAPSLNNGPEIQQRTLSILLSKLFFVSSRYLQYLRPTLYVNFLRLNMV